MITCRQAESLFDAYLNGELSDALRCEVQAHQLSCGSCRRTLAILQTTAEVIARDRGEPGLGAEFTDRLLACLERRETAAGATSRRWRRWAIGGGSGVAAAAAIAVSLTAWLMWTPGPTPADNRVAGRIVHAVQLYPIADERMAGPTEDRATLLPVTVGYLARSAASAYRDGQEAINAFAEVGQWGVLYANQVILMGAAEVELSSPPIAEEVDLEQVGSLFELSDMLQTSPAAEEGLELI